MTPSLIAETAELRRRRELANFLLVRRARMSPERVGFVSRARRRVSGLRREEVAELAGISASWYTWLEQGRPIRVSAETLDRLSQALRLQQEERAQLFALAGMPSHGLVHRDEPAPPELQLLLDKFDPWPALVVCTRWDVVQWNRGAAKLFGDFGELPKDERNFVWLLLSRPAFRSLFIEDERMLRCVLGHFRAEFADRLADAHWTRFVEQLERSSPEFRTLWREHSVVRPPDWRKEMMHADLGRLTFDPITLEVPPEHQLRVLFFRPADAETAASFR